MNRPHQLALISALVLLLAAAPKAASPQPPLPDYLTAPGEPSGRRTVMFIFAHFDDDSTISGTINMHLRSGWDVHAVWLTSAGAGGYFWGTVEDRRAEMDIAADKMGLGPEQRHVLGVSGGLAPFARPGRAHPQDAGLQLPRAASPRPALLPELHLRGPGHSVLELAGRGPGNPGVQRAKLISIGL